jgi:hypothetical protein
LHCCGRCSGLHQTGAREEVYCQYEIGTDDKGVITGLKIQFYK